MTKQDVAPPEHHVQDATRPLPWAPVVKWVLIALVLALLVFVAAKLTEEGQWIAVVGVAFVAMAVLAVYGTRGAVPLKYLFPGLIFLVALQIWPIAYTVQTSFTNYGDGHKISKQDSIEAIIANSVREVPGSPRYKLSVAVKDEADLAIGDAFFLLTDPKGKTLVGDISGLEDLTDGVEKAPNGKITKAAGYQILTAIQVNSRKDLEVFAVPTTDGGGIKRVGLSEAFEGRATVSHDPASDTLTDSATGKKYIVGKNATWVPADGQGEAFSVGWKEGVGLDNYKSVLTNETLRAGFLKILSWNLVFAVVSVASTFLMGMLLALLLNDPRLRGKAIYRSVLILPFALPVFVTALVWASMFNQDFGLINQTLHLNIDWLGNPWAARSALLITNLWLGFPYAFIVCTGALQSIPGDVLEAAKIDGASAFRTMRSVIAPLLLVAIGPLMIASFAFNFNNFTLIYLLNQGGPFVSGNSSIGSTDLLITYAYRLAFSGVKPNYGLASTVSIFIFFIVALITYQGFRRTKALEEVN